MIRQCTDLVLISIELQFIRVSFNLLGEEGDAHTRGHSFGLQNQLKYVGTTCLKTELKEVFYSSLCQSIQDVPR